MACSTTGKTLKRANSSTIQDKFLVGYQGWFTCPGDGTPLDPHHHGWLHWLTYPLPDGGRPNTDLWPDVSEYSPSELFPVPGLKLANGDQAFVFSSRNAQTVQRHFHWMARHGVDGAFLQRFLGQCDLESGNEGIRNQRDEVGDHVRSAAEKEGRVFAIMYDISGVAPDRILHVLQKDWVHLLRTKRVLDSPNYLKEKGKPVVSLWGFGMNDQGHDPAMVRAVTDYIRSNTPGGAYIIGGGPAHWRTSTNDADRNPEFVDVWLEAFDAISPWTIGRYNSLEDVDRFSENNVKGDLELIRKRNEEAEQGVPGRRHIDYIPVVLPGGSGFNLSEGKWGWNDIKRFGGRFLWRQLWNLRRQGVRTIYGAMWDEYDEGTAFMPVVSKKRNLPVHEKYNFMALDEDGFDIPSDWFMRIAGFAAEGLRGERFIHETFPSKELDDYWSTRPRYEEKDEMMASGSKDEKGQSWEDWQKAEKEKREDEPPPPPYTLEVEEAAEPAAPVAPSVPVAQSQPPPIAERPQPPQGPPPTVAPRPVAAQPAVGILNATPASPERPAVPLSSRPSMSRPPPSSENTLPPTVPLRSRPPQGQPGVHSPSSSLSHNPSITHSPAASISSLTDDFARQRLSSSTSPRPEPPPLHPAHPQASRPVSPLRTSRPTSASTSPTFTNFTPAPYDDASTPVASFPVPGLPQTRPPTSPNVAQPQSGPWSQAAWPPPEWGVKPSSPTSSAYSGNEQKTGYGSDYGNEPGGYRPAYMPSYNSYSPSPPPLASRPSGSAGTPSPGPPSPYGAAPAPYGPSSYSSPAPYGSSSYGSSSSTPYGSSSSAPYGSSSSTPYGPSSSTPYDSGGFAFPQAHPSSAYAPSSGPAPPPQPHGAPQPYGGGGYGGYAPPPQAPPGFPGGGGGGYGYNSYGGGGGGYGGYPGSNTNNAYAAPTGPPPPPPSHPARPTGGAASGWSSYPGSAPLRPPNNNANSGVSGTSGFGVGKLSNLAQTGLAQGNKLFGKFMK